MILGISGSPRKNGVTADAVQTILNDCEGETKYISLAGKRINGCISCLGCVRSNKCIVEDDFKPIIADLEKADVIVFGAPNYYNQMNALAHAFWERCFCFRHDNNFVLQGKKIVQFTTGYQTNIEENPVLKSMKVFADYNKLEILDQFAIDAYSQCFDCAVGKTCVSGNVVKKYGKVEAITSDMLPAKFCENNVSKEKAARASEIINKKLTN